MNDSAFGLTAVDLDPRRGGRDRDRRPDRHRHLLHESLRLSRSSAGLGRGQGLRPRLRIIGRKLYLPDSPEELPPAHWLIVRNRRFASPVWCTWPMVCQGESVHARGSAMVDWNPNSRHHPPVPVPCALSTAAHSLGRSARTSGLGAGPGGFGFHGSSLSHQARSCPQPSPSGGGS